MRKRVLVLGTSLAVIAIVTLLWMRKSDEVVTDDAYVHGNQVQLSARTAGVVTAIHAETTDYVRRGQVLIELDITDSALALAAAEANLATTIREVRQLYQSVNAAEAELRQRQVEATQRERDLKRRTEVRTGSISEEERQHARSAYEGAKAALVATRERLAGLRALTAATTVVEHPRVLRAKTAVREAYLALHRTKVISPVDGHIARRPVQLGQRVELATALLTIVPLEQVWVDANFKEVQLADVRIGQPVTLTADVYGDDVVYRGKVSGVAPGTGSAFALLPPQNATGNWVKVVQRVPVRIELDQQQLTKHPLRLGLSMVATVDTTRRDGPMLASNRREQPVYATTVYEHGTDEADIRIQDIVQAHLGAES